ncbi:hypothetical protein P8452_01760 [Trifolium repens]|nr:hypothetical protein P8452_01760 [Trifolium repens]
MSQLSIIMFSLFAIVLVHSHAEIIVTTIDAPTPAPQPNLPMNGSTEGSLQPEGIELIEEMISQESSFTHK